MLLGLTTLIYRLNSTPQDPIFILIQTTRPIIPTTTSLLAHPLGANFKEYILKARFQPSKKWIFDGRIIRASFGEDNDTTNFGGNIRLPNVTREMEFDNAIGQGISATTTILGLECQLSIST